LYHQFVRRATVANSRRQCVEHAFSDAERSKDGGEEGHREHCGDGGRVRELVDPDERLTSSDDVEIVVAPELVHSYVSDRLNRYASVNGASFSCDTNGNP
jgi:hypothetical protein